jgi:hypothetical protein
MQQYESDNERKHKLISQLERELQQRQNENNLMSQQLFQLKSKSLQDREEAEGENEPKLDFEYADQVQRDKMVELLKRNHDVMMEKYEVYAERNKILEKKALEQEKLYVTIKAENEDLANQLYQVKRQAEDFRQEKLILESKFNTADSLCKQATE